MAAKVYDPEVWFFLKAIWCAVPKISWGNLVELVEEVTNLPVPSPDSVRKKAKSENWTKNIRSYCRKADKTLDNIKCRLFSELREEYEKLQRDRAILATPEKGSLIPKNGIPDFPGAILEDIAYKNRKTATVLQEHRRRTGKIGQLLDDSMDWMYQAKETLFRLNMPDQQVADNEIDKARQQFTLLEAMVEKIESFSRTSKNLMQMDFLLFGINTDDTRDSDSEDRLTALQDESEFDKARMELEQQYLQMQEQSAWIQEGHFEREVQAEIEEQMRLEQQEQDLDDFDDDDDDEADEDDDQAY